MKKIVLIFSMVTMGFLLSSCLESGDQSYEGVMQFSYVTMDEESGLIYANTASGLAITSDKIKTLTPNRYYFISYTWNSEYGSNGAICNAVVSDVVPVPYVMLEFQEVPSDTIIPLTKFEPIVYDSEMSDYKYDLWVFSYQWEREKDEVATVEFYTSSEIFGDNDQIIIDVRLRVVKDANKTETGTVSLDVKDLRNMLKSSFETGSKKVRFRYYVKDVSGGTKLVTSDAYSIIY